MANGEAAVKGENQEMYMRDPVEKTPEYEAAMDRIQPILDREFPETYMGICHTIWARKKQLLAQNGISWQSPAELNPNIIFD